MFHLQSLLKKSHSSKFSLALLNFFLNRMLPFNSPHGLKIIYIDSECVKTSTAYKKRNLNHLKTIHACAIATVGELAAGLILSQHFSTKTYRFLMSKMEVDYHYRAQQNLMAECTFTQENLSMITQKLTTENKTVCPLESLVYDQDKNLIATVKTLWHLKQWSHIAPPT